MHESVRAYLQSVIEAFELEGPVYEFGYTPSRGTPHASATLRSLIDIGYVGSDLEQKAEVDQLEELSSLPYPSASARTICSINVLERLFEPQRAIDEMIRILAPGGLLLLCASLQPERHGAVDHYWQVTPQGLERLLSPLEATLLGWQGAEQAPHTVFGIGCKGPVPSQFLSSTRRFVDALERRCEAAQRTRRSARLRRWLWSWLGKRTERARTAQHCQTHFALHFPLAHKLELQHVLLDDAQPGSSTGSRIDFQG